MNLNTAIKTATAPLLEGFGRAIDAARAAGSTDAELEEFMRAMERQIAWLEPGPRDLLVQLLRKRAGL